jgi:hypothetical protein
MSDEEILPDGWIEVIDEGSGKPYWYDKNDLTDPVWVRPDKPTPKLPSGWAKVKGDGGAVYYHNNTTNKTQNDFPLEGQAWDTPLTSSDVGEVQQPQNVQPVVDISSLVNRELTDQEIETIRKMNNGETLINGLVQYDSGFNELKNRIGTAQPQPVDLSGYTRRLEAFRVLLLEKLSIIKDKLDRLSLLEELSGHLVQKLNDAKELFKSAITKLDAASVQNNTADYEALGKKITELEGLIAEIERYPGMGAQTRVGGRRRSKTKHRKSRGKNKKTKRVKRTQTKKRKIK